MRNTLIWPTLFESDYKDKKNGSNLFFLPQKLTKLELVKVSANKVIVICSSILIIVPIDMFIFLTQLWLVTFLNLLPSFNNLISRPGLFN